MGSKPPLQSPVSRSIGLSQYRSQMSDSSSNSTSSEPGLWRFQTIHGRKFNLQNNDWSLPSDQDEYERLDMVHTLLKITIGGLYFPTEPVQRRLRPTDGTAPGVLDIGCGTGVWAIQMAQEFEHAEVVGIDLVAPVISGGPPVNCRFEVDDINLPLSHYANCFNVIHMRTVDFGIRNYPKFLYEVARLLRPDGLLLLVQPEFRLYGENREVWPNLEEGEDGFSYLHKILQMCHLAISTSGVAVDAVLSYDEMLGANPNFESINVRRILLPTSPWKAGLNESDRRVCELNRDQLMRLCYAFRPLLLKEGNAPEDVSRWIRGALHELESMQNATMIRWTYATAVRTRAPWIPPPPRDRSSTS